jgi:hypothetical protein
MWEQKIRAMLDAGGGVEQTACWFMRQLMATPGVTEEDLTPFELTFWRNIKQGYVTWLSKRKPN